MAVSLAELVSTPVAAVAAGADEGADVASSRPAAMPARIDPRDEPTVGMIRLDYAVPPVSGHRMSRRRSGRVVERCRERLDSDAHVPLEKWVSRF